MFSFFLRYWCASYWDVISGSEKYRYSFVYVDTERVGDQALVLVTHFHQTTKQTGSSGKAVPTSRWYQWSLRKRHELMMKILPMKDNMKRIIIRKMKHGWAHNSRDKKIMLTTNHNIQWNDILRRIKTLILYHNHKDKMMQNFLFSQTPNKQLISAYLKDIYKERKIWNYFLENEFIWVVDEQCY